MFNEKISIARTEQRATNARASAFARISRRSTPRQRRSRGSDNNSINDDKRYSRITSRCTSFRKMKATRIDNADPINIGCGNALELAPRIDAIRACSRERKRIVVARGSSLTTARPRTEAGARRVISIFTRKVSPLEPRFEAISALTPETVIFFWKIAVGQERKFEKRPSCTGCTKVRHQTTDLQQHPRSGIRISISLGIAIEQSSLWSVLEGLQNNRRLYFKMFSTQEEPADFLIVGLGDQNDHITSRGNSGHVFINYLSNCISLQSFMCIELVKLKKAEANKPKLKKGEVAEEDPLSDEEKVLKNIQLEDGSSLFSHRNRNSKIRCSHLPPSE